MIAFGHFYVDRTFVLYELEVEVVAGRRRYAACLSENPRVCFASPDPAEAAGKLRHYVTAHLRAAA